MQGQDKPGQVSERHTIKCRLFATWFLITCSRPFPSCLVSISLILIFILRCTCDDGWTGKHCSDLYIPCHPSPCQNGGQCESIGAYGYQCHCPSGEPNIIRRSDYLHHPSLDPLAFWHKCWCIHPPQSPICGSADASYRILDIPPRQTLPLVLLWLLISLVALSLHLPRNFLSSTLQHMLDSSESSTQGCSPNVESTQLCPTGSILDNTLKREPIQTIQCFNWIDHSIYILLPLGDNSRYFRPISAYSSRAFPVFFNS